MILYTWICVQNKSKSYNYLVPDPQTAGFVFSGHLKGNESVVKHCSEMSFFLSLTFNI
jgi:hypothetical protein